MHYLWSQRKKNYSNSLTFYVLPDITSRTFQTCHGWTWGLCSLDFIQHLLLHPYFQHSGLRLESLGDLYSYTFALKSAGLSCWRQAALGARERLDATNLPTPTPPTVSNDFQCKPSGWLSMGLLLELSYPQIRGFMLPGPRPFQSYSRLDFSTQGFILAVWMPHYQVEVCFKRRKWDFFFSGKKFFSLCKEISTFRYRRLTNNRLSVCWKK